jgi:phage repressor protein C with HTH and peptisase S24 domain
MNTLRERLIWARTQRSERDGREFTQTDLAAKAGVTQGNIAHLESGRTQTSRKIAAIAEALGVSVAWLSEGKGDPFAAAPAVRSLLPGGMPVVVSSPDRPARIKIPKVKLKLSAGITGFGVDPDHRDGGVWELPPQWVEKHGFNPEKLIAIDVKGESMEPSLYEGDLVVINIADTTPANGYVYAINYEGEAVIKRMIREGGQWYLASDNPSPKFARRACRGAECIIVGRVVRRETDQI